jgi:hypothetical protein
MTHAGGFATAMLAVIVSLHQEKRKQTWSSTAAHASLWYWLNAFGAGLQPTNQVTLHDDIMLLLPCVTTAVWHHTGLAGCVQQVC